MGTWQQGGPAPEHSDVQIYIKDLKSSNGTFINNERLSPEGMESEPFEVKSEDILVSAVTSMMLSGLSTGIWYRYC